MAAVVGLSLVAERLSPRLAGLLAGFPHGIAIVLWFIGREQGAAFAAEAAGFATAGLAANVVLACVHARLAGRLGDSPAAVVVAALGGVGAFLGCAALLRLIAPGPWGAAALTLAAIGAAHLLLRAGGTAAPPPRPTAASRAPRPAASPGELLARAALAGGIVALITGLAALIGPRWAGLLAGFPVVTFPLLVILQLRHGAEAVGAVVRHYPTGLLALLVYTLTVRWSFAALGAGTGTLIGLASSLAWLSGASALSARFRPGSEAPARGARAGGLSRPEREAGRR